MIELKYNIVLVLVLREIIFIVVSFDDSVDVYYDNGEEFLKIFDLLFYFFYYFF